MGKIKDHVCIFCGGKEFFERTESGDFWVCQDCGSTHGVLKENKYRAAWRNAPCLKCSVRKPDCHSDCEKYREYKIYKNNEKRERMMKSISDGYSIDEVIKNKKLGLF